MTKTMKRHSDRYGRWTVLENASPNRFPIRLIRYASKTMGSLPCFVVEETDPDGYWEFTADGCGAEFDGNLAKARAYYAERVAKLRDTPNWEAQARYDEEHGTVNGYDPRIEMWRREY